MQRKRSIVRFAAALAFGMLPVVAPAQCAAFVAMRIAIGNPARRHAVDHVRTLRAEVEEFNDNPTSFPLDED